MTSPLDSVLLQVLSTTLDHIAHKVKLSGSIPGVGVPNLVQHICILPRRVSNVTNILSN